MAAQPNLLRERVHPERLRAVLDPRLGDATLVRLIACDRLRSRLNSRLGLDDRSASSPAEAPAWLIGDPAEAARRAGALLHGQAVRAVLSGPVVGELVAAIGPDAHALALRYGALASPRDHGGDLVGAILRDGQACLGAWLQGQDDGLRRAILLSLPPGTPVEAERFDPDLSERADAIMARVAMSYAQAEPPGHDLGEAGDGHG